MPYCYLAPSASGDEDKKLRWITCQLWRNENQVDVGNVKHNVDAQEMEKDNVDVPTQVHVSKV